MTTARDLVLIALTMPPGELTGQGDLSLALAGAEAIDLLRSGVLRLDGDRMVPGPQTASGDPLLEQASVSLVRQEPYETVDDWLWRRAENLVSAYADALERAGLVVRSHGHGLRLLSGKAVLTDSQERREAEERRASDEPVLAGLLAALGQPSDADDGLLDDAVTTVLAAVGDAAMQLEAVRLQRDVENAAFDNVWRGW
ncbi:GPP34 family phosphoprotein [Streptomyces sp. NPDC051105]|uniref:GOLPH3/VPS74 family protein n=1 Tax=Streptomyces sp. NPDC051105 TaxID=3154843 RepID=UPI003424F04B